MGAGYCVNKPTVEQQGGRLIAGNGSWTNDNGIIDGYVYVFARGGVFVQGEVPSAFEGWRRSDPDSPLILYVRPPEQTPAGFNLNVFALSPSDVGQVFRVFVYSATRSKYVYEFNGETAWDGWEYGRYILNDPNRPAVSDPLTVAQFETPPPPPPPPTGPSGDEKVAQAKVLLRDAISIYKSKGVNVEPTRAYWMNMIGLTSDAAWKPLRDHLRRYR